MDTRRYLLVAFVLGWGLGFATATFCLWWAACRLLPVLPTWDKPLLF